MVPDPRDSGRIINMMIVATEWKKKKVVCGNKRWWISFSPLDPLMVSVHKEVLTVCWSAFGFGSGTPGTYTYCHGRVVEPQQPTSLTKFKSPEDVGGRVQ